MPPLVSLNGLKKERDWSLLTRMVSQECSTNKSRFVAKTHPGVGAKTMLPASFLRLRNTRKLFLTNTDNRVWFYCMSSLKYFTVADRLLLTKRSFLGPQIVAFMYFEINQLGELRKIRVHCI